MRKPEKLVMKRRKLPLIIQVENHDGTMYDVGLLDTTKSKVPRLRTGTPKQVEDFYREDNNQ